MKGGTLIVSRAVNLFSYFKNRFVQLGFDNIYVTGADKDSLNMLINDIKPRLMLISSSFYQAGTPYMLGELHNRFPKLNIAAVSLNDYPLTLAPWFIWHGVNSYINLWEEGYDNFHNGLQAIRNGEQYVSPIVQKIIDHYDEFPSTNNKLTKRHRECLIMLCCGFPPERIGDVLHITRKTVNNHLVSLYNTFHAKSREEMIAMAWELELITKKDIRFYDKKKDYFTMPEWANVQITINKGQSAFNKSNFNRGSYDFKN